MRDVYQEPIEDIGYCVDGLIPTAGLSILAGKPKIGKSTLVRQLAGCVAAGTAFLGRETLQGSVLYLALEEKKSEVSRHFRELGVLEDSPIFLHCGGIGQAENAIAEIESLISKLDNVVLVVIDPLFHFLRVRDGNDYMSVYSAMEKLMELGRRSESAILAVHHLKKRGSDDLMDGALGSTAITAAVDTYMALTTRGETRNLTTRQRYGLSMEETQLVWDAQSRQMDLGQTATLLQQNNRAVTSERIEIDILEMVSKEPGCTQEQVFTGVIGKTVQKKNALRALVQIEALLVQGSGKRGDPYSYWVRENREAVSPGELLEHSDPMQRAAVPNLRVDWVVDSFIAQDFAALEQGAAQ